MFLNTVSEVDLAIRLRKLSLLPEQYRQTFVKTVTSYAIDGEDLYAIESLRIQSVFTAEELADFRARIRTELLPNLGDVRRTWQSNHSSAERPDGYMEPLLDSFSALKKEFADDPYILSSIAREVERAQEWISENMPDDADKERPARAFGDVNTPEQPPAQLRGIFDDVDE
jgi:hypothetical protein